MVQTNATFSLMYGHTDKIRPTLCLKKHPEHFGLQLEEGLLKFNNFW